jgi:hypothetical protein
MIGPKSGPISRAIVPKYQLDRKSTSRSHPSALIPFRLADTSFPKKISRKIRVIKPCWRTAELPDNPQHSNRRKRT